MKLMYINIELKPSFLIEWHKLSQNELYLILFTLQSLSCLGPTEERRSFYNVQSNSITNYASL